MKIYEISLDRFSITEQFQGYFDDNEKKKVPVHNILINAAGVVSNGQSEIEIFDQKVKLSEMQLCIAASERDSFHGSVGSYGNTVHIPKEVFLPFYEMLKQDIDGYAVTLHCHIRKRKEWMRLGFEKLEVQRKFSNQNPNPTSQPPNQLHRVEKLLKILIAITCLIWLFLIFGAK
jgi:hypothetical protein